MKYATLRVWHPDCWMLDLTEHHPDICIESRGVCPHGATVRTGAVMRSEHPAALQAAIEAPVPADVRREILHVGDGHADIYSHYPSYRSLYEATVATGMLIVGPVVHEGGTERWDVLADAVTLQAGLAQLREVAEVRIERVSDSKPSTASASGLVSKIGNEVSDRQLKVLERAVAEGYYEWPRARDLKDLAGELGVSPPTALEHLRRAEGRIVPAIVAELARERRRSR